MVDTVITPKNVVMSKIRLIHHASKLSFRTKVPNCLEECSLN